MMSRQDLMMLFSRWAVVRVFGGVLRAIS
jgi:hypothetical protein